MNHIYKLFSYKTISLFLGIINTIVVVQLFGTSREIEIYFVAQTLVFMVTSLAQSGQLAELFLPEYLNQKSKSNLNGFNSLNVVVNRVLFFGILICAFIFFISPYLIKIIVPNYDIVDQNKAVLYFKSLMPIILIQIINSFFLIVLNAEKKYGKAEILGILNISINIILLLLLFDSLGVWAMIISVSLAKSLELLFFFISLKKVGYVYYPTKKLKGFDHKVFFSQLKNTIVYVGSTQIYNIALTASISYLPQGTFAIFKYIQNLVVKISNVSINSFITIFYTEFSSNKSNFKVIDRTSSSLISLNTVIILSCIFLGNYIIYFLWGSDKFDNNSVFIAYIFLIFNMIGLYFSSIGSIYRKMVMSHGYGGKLYLFWSIGQIVCAALSYFLISFFDLYGLYLIVCLNYLVMFLFSYTIYSIKIKKWKFKFFTKTNIFYMIIVFLSLIIKYAVGYEVDFILQKLLLPLILILLIIIPLKNLYFSIYK